MKELIKNYLEEEHNGPVENRTRTTRMPFEYSTIEPQALNQSAIFYYVDSLSQKPHPLGCVRDFDHPKSSTNQTTHFSVWWCIDFLI